MIFQKQRVQQKERSQHQNQHPKRRDSCGGGEVILQYGSLVSFLKEANILCDLTSSGYTLHFGGVATGKTTLPNNLLVGTNCEMT